MCLAILDQHMTGLLPCPGGVYYRGQVAQVFDQQPDIEASEEQQEQYDPWEAVEVVWDGGKSSSGYGGVNSTLPF